MSFVNLRLSVEVNERYVICEDHSSFPINMGAPRIAISNDYKKFTVIDTVVFLNAGYGLAQKGNELMKRCMFLCKYTIYSSV